MRREGWTPGGRFPIAVPLTQAERTARRAAFRESIERGTAPDGPRPQLAPRAHLHNPDPKR